MRLIDAGAVFFTLMLVLLSAGCTGEKTTGSAVTVTATVSPVGTTGAAPVTVTTGVPVTVTAVIPQTQATVPPGALKMGESARFGLGAEKPGKVSVVSYSLWDQYEWGNTFWGNRYFNATPKAGHQFLVLFIRLTNTGTQPMLAPGPALFTVVSESMTYEYVSVDDPTLWIKGTSKRQLDYAVTDERRDGYLNADEDGAINGFLIYEVPKTFTEGYVDATFNGNNRVMWKIP